MHEFQEPLEIAEAAARDAGKVLLQGVGSSFQVSKKGRINLVTEMDVRSEAIIVERIGRHFPQHQILAEEAGLSGHKAEFLWVIDPLDGTTNYAHGYRFFSISIALQKSEKTVLGLVYDPVTNEMFSAVAGRGARLNGDFISVSRESNLEDSMLCTGFSYQEDGIRRNLQLFNRLIGQARAIRRDGSAALDLCYVACGRFDGFWELHLGPWDVAAGTLMIEEAGGRATRFDGSPCTIHDRELLATNGQVHERMIRELHQAASASAP